MDDSKRPMTFEELFENSHFMSIADLREALARLPPQRLNESERNWRSVTLGETHPFVTLAQPAWLDSKQIAYLSNHEKCWEMLYSLRHYELGFRTVALPAKELQVIHATLEHLEPSWSERFLLAWMPLDKIYRTMDFEKRNEPSAEEEETIRRSIATLRALIVEKVKDTNHTGASDSRPERTTEPHDG